MRERERKKKSGREREREREKKDTQCSPQHRFNHFITSPSTPRTPLVFPFIVLTSDSTSGGSPARGFGSGREEMRDGARESCGRGTNEPQQ